MEDQLEKARIEEIPVVDIFRREGCMSEVEGFL
jgi:hypothetical protein